MGCQDLGSREVLGLRVRVTHTAVVLVLVSPSQLEFGAALPEKSCFHPVAEGGVGA